MPFFRSIKGGASDVIIIAEEDGIAELRAKGMN